MGFRIANVLWKHDGHGVLVMASGKIHRINKEGAKIWLAIDRGGEVSDDKATTAFITGITKMGLLEVDG